MYTNEHSKPPGPLHWSDSHASFGRLLRSGKPGAPRLESGSGDRRPGLVWAAVPSMSGFNNARVRCYRGLAGIPPRSAHKLPRALSGLGQSGRGRLHVRWPLRHGLRWHAAVLSKRFFFQTGMGEESTAAATLLSYYVSDSNGNDASSTLSDILPHLSAESDSELDDFHETESIVSTNSASASLVGLKSDIETAQILSYYTRNRATGGLSPHLTHEDPHGFVAHHGFVAQTDDPEHVRPDSGHSSSSAPSSAHPVSAEASADQVSSAETDLRAALAGEQNRCSQLLDLLNQHLKDLDTLTSREEERRTAYARRMVQRASRQLAARAFCLLYGNVSVSRQQHRAVMKMRRAQLRAAFHLFLDQVWQTREHWVAVERVTREMQYRLQEAAWRAICHEGLARWAAALQLLWWQRWKAIIQRVQVQRRALCILMRPSLRQAWRSWQDMTCWGQRACQHAESTRARHLHRRLAQGWCRWQDWHARIARMRQIGARILVRWKGSALCAAWTTWQNSRLRLRRLREAAVKWRLLVFHRASTAAFDRCGCPRVCA